MLASYEIYLGKTKELDIFFSPQNVIKKNKQQQKKR